jgi:hypothetical protein
MATCAPLAPSLEKFFSHPYAEAPFDAGSEDNRRPHTLAGKWKPEEFRVE